MVKIVNCKGFVEEIQKSKSDYHDKTDQVQFGLPIHQIIEIALKHMDESLEGWGNLEKPLLHQISELLELSKSFEKNSKQDYWRICSTCHKKVYDDDYCSGCQQCVDCYLIDPKNCDHFSCKYCNCTNQDQCCSIESCLCKNKKKKKCNC